MLIPINLSKNYIEEKLDNVLICNNGSERFTEYQWYKDGVAINGATAQFLYQPDGLTGTYNVSVMTTEGTSLRTCGKVFNAGVATRSVSLEVFPNPVRTSDQFTVKIWNLTNKRVGRRCYVDLHPEWNKGKTAR